PVDPAEPPAGLVATLPEPAVPPVEGPGPLPGPSGSSGIGSLRFSLWAPPPHDSASETRPTATRARAMAVQTRQDPSPTPREALRPLAARGDPRLSGVAEHCQRTTYSRSPPAQSLGARPSISSRPRRIGSAPTVPTSSVTYSRE